MADARVEGIYEDRQLAREFLVQADGFMEDAQRHELNSESRAVLFHNVAICACDAVLVASALRVTDGDRSHILRLQTALGHLPGDTDELLERLDSTRARRGEASYQAFPVSTASVDEAEEAAIELLDLARDFVG